MLKDLPLGKLPNVQITPHIASRTVENVEVQGEAAVLNLLNCLKDYKNEL